VKAANPFSGITVEMLAEKFASPTTTMHHWLRFNCNRPTRDIDVWLGGDADRIWADLEDPFTFGKRPIYVGVDIALKQDTSAVVAMQRRPDGKWHALCRIWVPTADRPIDVTDVMQHLRELHAAHGAESIAYDPRFFDVPAKMLTDEGLPMVEVPQSLDHMTPAYVQLYGAIMGGRITHDDDPPSPRRCSTASPATANGGSFSRRARAAARSTPRSPWPSPTTRCSATNPTSRRPTKSAGWWRYERQRQGLPDGPLDLGRAGRPAVPMVAVLFMLAWNYVAPTFAIPRSTTGTPSRCHVRPSPDHADARHPRRVGAVKRLRAVRLPAFDRDEALAIAGLAILAAGVALSHGIPAALIVVGVGLLAYAVLYSLLARPTEPTP
jgi:hypothetical protein